MEVHHIADRGVALKFSSGIVAINPPEKQKRSLTSDIILNSYSAPIGGSKVFTASAGQKVFLGAGEYEKDGVAVRGFGSLTREGRESVQTTSWLVEADGIRILTLGDIADKKDVQPILSEIGEADVLIAFLSETKEDRLDASALAGIISATGVRVFIPIGTNGDVKKSIVKEVGAGERITGKCTLKKKNLVESEMRLILFE